MVVVYATEVTLGSQTQQVRIAGERGGPDLSPSSGTRKRIAQGDAVWAASMARRVAGRRATFGVSQPVAFTSSSPTWWYVP